MSFSKISKASAVVPKPLGCCKTYVDALKNGHMFCLSGFHLDGVLDLMCEVEALDNKTPLCYAISKRNLQLVKMLVSFGASLKSHDVIEWSEIPPEIIEVLELNKAIIKEE